MKDGFAACEIGEANNYGEFATKAYGGDGVSAIAELLPPASVVSAVFESDAVFGEYASRLRKRGITARPHGEMKGDERMVISLGGGETAERARIEARKVGLPAFIVVASPDASTSLGSRCYAPGSPFCGVKCVPPVGIAVAGNLVRGDSVGAFGAICSLSLAAFDYEAGMRATGSIPDRSLINAANELVTNALDLVRESGRGDKELPIRLAELSVKCALLSEASDFDLSRGSPDDCARTAAALFKHEGRTAPSRGECAFIFASALSKLYRGSLFYAGEFVPPPDNNLRAELMGEYFGLDEMTAAKLTATKIKNAPLAHYRVHEYRDELELAISDVSAAIDEGAKYFRRLYPDDGYSAREYFDRADMRTVIAFAPDSRPINITALTLMREFGLLDKYL